MQNREKNHEFTLKCPDTEQYYGGYYKLKIGLMSLDEMVYSGLMGGSTPEDAYLSKEYTIISMSPYSKSYFAIYAFYIWGEPIIDFANEANVLPVINLKADTAIVSGDGTKDNPYVIK